jgi:deoxycytidine triphosphate deaminase
MAHLLDDIGINGSFLVDIDIKKALPHLFGSGSYTEERIRHASYELRLGRVKIYIDPQPATHTRPEKPTRFQQVEWETDGKGKRYIEIWPRKRAQIYSLENLTFPDNVIGFVFGRGVIFASGLTSETTYVDPGFVGPIYIDLVNVSGNIIRLYEEMEIARLFIFKLSKSAGESYVPGKWKGIEQQLLEMPARKAFTEEELTKLKNIDIVTEIQKGCSIGDLLKQILIRQNHFQKIGIFWGIILTTFLCLQSLWPLISKINLPKWSWLGEQSLRMSQL